MAMLPALLVGGGFVSSIHTLRRTLETWREVRLPLAVITSPPVNFVSVLGLDQILAALRWWDSASVAVFWSVCALGIVLGAAAGAISGYLLALSLNLSAHLGHGLSLELDLEERG